MIDVQAVRKSYGAVLAVDNVSFAVKPGEIVAFVGPNGAGKSTVLKMLSTYLPPDAGKILVSGCDAVRDPLAVRRNIGYLPENNILEEGMRVDKFLRFVGKAHWLKGARLKEKFDWVVDRCRLEEVLYKRIGECSKGYHRRIALAIAIIHDPPVLLLDEPSHGLDPLQVMALRDFILSLKTDKAILFSTHIIQEVVAICDRVLIINDGVLLADGTLAGIAIAAGRPPAATCGIDAPPAELRVALAQLKLGGVKSFEETGPNSAQVEMTILDTGFRKELDTMLDSKGWALKFFDEHPLDLEEIFAEIIRKSIQEKD